MKIRKYCRRNNKTSNKKQVNKENKHEEEKNSRIIPIEERRRDMMERVEEKHIYKSSKKHIKKEEKTI